MQRHKKLMIPLYVTQGNISLLEEEDDYALNAVRDIDTARKINEKFDPSFTNLAFQIKKGNIGHAILMIDNDSYRNPRKDTDLYPIVAAIGDVGNIYLFKAFMNAVDINKFPSHLIAVIAINAVDKGHYRILSYMFNNYDLDYFWQDIIKHAIIHNYEDIVLLMKNTHSKKILKHPYLLGHVHQLTSSSMIQLLLDRFEHEEGSFYITLLKRGKLGQKDVVKMMLPYSNNLIKKDIPMQRQIISLMRSISKKNYMDILSLLLENDTIRENISEKDLIIYQKKIRDYNTFLKQ